MKMPSCQDVTELASEYLEGRMGWADWATMRVHLAMCPPCQEYVRSLGLTIDALQHLPEPEREPVEADLARIFQRWRDDPDALPDVDVEEDCQNVDEDG